MREFVVPKTDTRILGKIELEYAFKLTARYDPPQESHTPRGTFRYQDIISGEASGARRMRLLRRVVPGGELEGVFELDLAEDPGIGLRNHKFTHGLLLTALRNS